MNANIHLIITHDYTLVYIAILRAKIELMKKKKKKKKKKKRKRKRKKKCAGPDTICIIYNIYRAWAFTTRSGRKGADLLTNNAQGVFF